MSLERGTTARLSLSNFARKISFRNREYNKVEDLYDTRIPLHNEQAFQHGLRFKAKFIGSLEIARPSCKIDIITAMRRIRYEYKVKGIRKVRCYINVSTTGVKISKRKRRRSRKRYSEEQLFVMQHPIYRIFYVSHDSQDLKIFSYITREVPDNTFRCNVFKAYKKGLALTIVRSLGQAFDVCHKLNPKPQKKKKTLEPPSSEAAEATKEEKEGGAEDGDADEVVKEDLGSPSSVPSSWKQFNTDLDTALATGSADKEDQKIADLNKDLMQLNFDPFNMPLNMPVANGNPLSMDPFQPVSAVGGDAGAVAYPPLTVSNLSTSLPDFPDGVDPATASANVLPAHVALLGRPRPRPSLSGQQQVVTENMFTDPNQSRMETESPVSIGEALDGSLQRKVSNPFHPVDPEREGERKQFFFQMKMMKEQLDSEKTARIESQARVEHLLMQNKELLSHLQKLMSQLAQIQTLQQSMVAAAPPPQATTAPPTMTTPTTSPAPLSQTTTVSDTNLSTQQEPLLSSNGGELSPLLTDPQTSPQPTMASTPSTKTSETADEVVGISDMTLGLDFDLITPPANNDPFLPQEATSS